MKIAILHAHRCNPTITANRFKKMNGVGTAYITDSLKEKEHIGMVEITENETVEIEKAVSEGRDILYRVSSFGGAHRVFKSK